MARNYDYGSGGIIIAMTLLVHYYIDPTVDALEILRVRLNAGIQLAAGQEIQSLSEFQVLINGTPSREHIIASPNLNSLIIPYAGIPESTRAILSEFPQLKVYNLHHNAAPTAEMAIALLMAAAKFLVPIDRDFRAHNWSPRYQSNPSLLLEGKTALILGFGHIGQRVGRFCQALGMQVIGVRRRPDAPLVCEVQAEIHPPTNLDQLLPRADTLIITTPYTSETDHLIEEQQLALMIPGGILVNVGRGRIVDQTALYHALSDGTLGAAGLDVWYRYPGSPEERSSTPPADYPFDELDNIVMSPHRGGDSRDTEMLRMHHLAELLNALHNGSPPPNQVDISAGY
jgi:phosphoglycerate dehydrogenase-like enzyme